MTQARRILIEIFVAQAAPVTVDQLLTTLKKRGLSVNKTTVYRELDFLKEQKIIREIDLLEGRKRYELRGDEHHHHLVCLECRDIRCITMEEDLDAIERGIEKEHGFRVASHTLEFFGVCAQCQRSSKGV